MVIIPQYLRMFKKLTADGRIKVERGRTTCYVTLQGAAAVTIRKKTQTTKLKGGFFKFKLAGLLLDVIAN